MVLKFITVFLNFDIQSPKKMITINYIIVVSSYPWLLIIKNDEQFVSYPKTLGETRIHNFNFQFFFIAYFVPS